MTTESFGKFVQMHRKKKEWTVKEFIERLGSDVSPAYITKIEVHGEIPSPLFVCKIAEVFDLDTDELWARAKKDKVENFDRNLEKKYQHEVGLCRLQKKATLDE